MTSITFTPANPLKAYQQNQAGLQGLNPSSEIANPSFPDLIKQPVIDAVQASHKSDQAILHVAASQMSELEFTQAITEANLALQKFRTVYQTSLESFKKIIDMPM